MFKFREIKVSEKITDGTVKNSFDPDARIESAQHTEMIEVQVFDPDVRGCYRTILVPVTATTEY